MRQAAGSNVSSRWTDIFELPSGLDNGTRKMRCACHHPGDRLAIVFIAGAPILEERVEPPDPLEADAGSLKPERHAVIGERELRRAQPWRAAEIARRIDPHGFERLKRALGLGLCPWLVRKEMREPKDHAETQVLLDLQHAPVALDQRAHVRDLWGKHVLIKEAIRDVALISIHRTETEARIRPTQVLLHFPDDAAARDDEGRMNIACQSGAARAI